jgi:hypothetical protein
MARQLGAGHVAAVLAKTRVAPVPQGKALARLVRAATEWRAAGEYEGTSPGMRAQDRHPFEITGKRCLSCHDGSGKAPRFAYGGTIARGEDWVWAADTWTPPGPPSYGWGGYGPSEASGVYGSHGWRGKEKGWPEKRSDPAANVEVRVIGSDGLVFETVTDEDGNLPGLPPFPY